jgi:predicted O-methyltransferase YrrM
MPGLRTIYRRLVGTQAATERTEQERLAALPKAECETSELWVCAKPWLAETFTDQQIDADWAEDVLRLTALDLPKMAGGVNPGDRRALYYLVRRTKPRSVLEIGTHIASSTVAMALAAARNRAESVETTIITADIQDVNDPVHRPWEAHRSSASPRSLVAAAGCGQLVQFEISSSIDTLTRPNRRFGLIFLDGSHDAHMVYQEIPQALRRLEPPGVILLHDYHPGERSLWPGQKPIVGPSLAVARLIAEGSALCALPLGNLPWPTKLGTHTTSLAVLSRT